MKLLKIERFGTHIQGVELKGDPRSPEPLHFRVVIPGGDVDITRTESGDFWVHVRVNGPEDLAANEDLRVGRVVDGRLDIRGMNAVESDPGDLGHRDLYHLAVRVEVPL